MASLSILYRHLICRCVKQSCPRPGCSRLMASVASDGLRHRPSALEKRILVLNKNYPSMEAVPEIVSYAQMRKARDYFRVRVSVLMIIATVVACGFVIRSGRKAQASGYSRVGETLEWHKSLKEEGDAQRAAEAAAAEKAQK